MGLHEYRPPTAFGGVIPAYVYRDDLYWLAAEAAEASRWMSRPDRPVRVDAADILHALVEAQKAQGNLTLPHGEPRGARLPWEGPGALPARERPAWSSRRRQGGY